MWRSLTVEDWLSRKKISLDRAKGPVLEIIRIVKAEGDKGLRKLTKELDGVELESFRIPKEELELAREKVDPSVVKALEQAGERITRFHKMQLRGRLWMKRTEPGVMMGMKMSPLSRVGAYVPGGRAAYPSTVLMATLPAKVAGVKEICCCTPPPINPITLVALEMAGIEEVYSLGGAQAIAAMALGTETIQKVQKIVGPGNLYVTTAKMILREIVEIDFPAGPSEIVVLADNTANSLFIAADILAQAEHDPDASCALVTTDPDLPSKVYLELERLLEGADRKEIIGQALKNSGFILVDGLEEAMRVVNTLAPEHLSIQMEDPIEALNLAESAGAVFIGPYSAVAGGDYASGSNHILPTGGYSGVFSGLDVDHFLRRSTVQIVSREGLEAFGDAVETLARAEGLSQHALSISLRRSWSGKESDK